MSFLHRHNKEIIFSLEERKKGKIGKRISYLIGNRYLCTHFRTKENGQSECLSYLPEIKANLYGNILEHHRTV
jgi:hypothetical protein